MAYESRTIGGVINANGTIQKGTGFTVTHQNTGVYIVKFDQPFDSVIYGLFIVNVEPDIDDSISNDNIIHPASLTSGPNAWVISGTIATMKYFTLDVSPNELTMKDYAISFTVVGYDLTPAEKSKKIPSNQLSPLPGRTITGIIGGDGEILDGEGFKVTAHPSPGSYTIKFDKPFNTIQPDTFTVKVSEFAEAEVADPKIYRAADPQMLRNGPNALVKDESRFGMKYFTFDVENDGLHMKNYPVEFTATGDSMPFP